MNKFEKFEDKDGKEYIINLLSVNYITDAGNGFCEILLSSGERLHVKRPYSNLKVNINTIT